MGIRWELGRARLIIFGVVLALGGLSQFPPQSARPSNPWIHSRTNNGVIGAEFEVGRI